MSVNQSEVIRYTSNIDIQYLLEAEGDDYCVEFTGYLAEILGFKKYGLKNEKELFRAVITNGYKRIMLVIFDISKIKSLYKQFVSGKILYLDGCQGHTVRGTKLHKDMNLLNYEIIIQPSSVVEMKGFHTHSTQQDVSIPTVEFIEIAKLTGDIRVKAYIKTVVAIANNRNGPLTFGTGSITDGTHKLPIIVSSFNTSDSENLFKGCCVLVTGTISHTGPLKLMCKNISAIEILKNDNNLSIDEVREANKPLKRLLELDSEEPSKKKHNMNIAINEAQKVPHQYSQDHKNMEL